MDALYWTSKSQHPFTAIIKLRKARTFFLYNSDCICLKEENNLHLWWLEGKLWGTFYFGWTIPLKQAWILLPSFRIYCRLMWCDELKPVAALQKLPAHLPSSPAGRQWPHAACVSLWSVIRQDRDKPVNCVAVKLSRLSRQMIHSKLPTG